MSGRTRSVLAKSGAFLLAAMLLYLALRNVDLSELALALRQADYVWLAPLVGVALFSHLLRAWRWTMLLDELPDSSTENRVGVGISFTALMIGYMVNQAAPRVGEFARAAVIARTRSRLFSGVIGTVIADRILDVAALGAGLLSVAFLLSGRSDQLRLVLIEPALERLGRVTPLVLLLLLAVAGGVVLWRALARRNRAPQEEPPRMQRIAESVGKGLATLLTSQRRSAILALTVVIWLCYTVMAYLPFLILGMVEPHDISFLDAWSIMLLGAVGIAIPSPGGVGSYHYITVQILQHLYDIGATPAATYAVLTHAAQLVLYTTVGGICVFFVGGFRQFRATAPDTAEETSPQSADVPG